MTSFAKPRWRVEVLGATHPVEEWYPVKLPTGRWARYVDRWDAEAAVQAIQRFQPHARLRISPM